jgi:hypothetical protein
MKGNMPGWIKLHRALLDHPRINDPDWLAVWVYLLLTATHAPYRALFNGRTIELRPGQLITGRHVIAAATGVSQSKVWRVLETLKTEQQIEQQPGNKSSLVSITNWEKYQGTEQQIEQQVSSNRAATEQQVSTLQEQKNRIAEREPRAHEVQEPPPVPPPPAVRAERPAWEEVQEFALSPQCGIAEWKALDWFQEMEGCGWLDFNHRPVRQWKPMLLRVKTKWEADGRPLTPPTHANNAQNSKRYPAPNPRNLGCTTDPVKQSKLIAAAVARQQREREEAMRKPLATQVAGPGHSAPPGPNDGQSS